MHHASNNLPIDQLLSLQVPKYLQYHIILIPYVHLYVSDFSLILFVDHFFFILAPFITILTKFISCRILAITGSLLLSMGFLCAAFTSSVPVLFLCLGILPGKQQKFDLHNVP